MLTTRGITQSHTVTQMMTQGITHNRSLFCGYLGPHTRSYTVSHPNNYTVLPHLSSCLLEEALEVSARATSDP
jgi:hypothetical protein